MNGDDVAGWIDRYVDVVDGDAQLQVRGLNYSCSFRLVMGPRTFVVHMHQGHVERVAVDPAALEEHYSFTLAADAATWVRMAEPVPAPMYQGMLAAQAHGSLLIEGDLLVFMQHLRCLVRQHELLRVTGLPASVHSAAQQDEAMVDS